MCVYIVQYVWLVSLIDWLAIRLHLSLKSIRPFVSPNIPEASASLCTVTGPQQWCQSPTTELERGTAKWKTNVLPVRRQFLFRLIWVARLGLFRCLQWHPAVPKALKEVNGTCATNLNWKLSHQVGSSRQCAQMSPSTYLECDIHLVLTITYESGVRLVLHCLTDLTRQSWLFFMVAIDALVMHRTTVSIGCFCRIFILVCSNNQ